MANKDGIEYSSRERYQLQVEEVFEGLNKMFEILMEKQVKPCFDKMIKENVFKSLRAFADWNTGYNLFQLEIFGNGVNLDELDLSNVPENHDAAHYKENLFSTNKQIVKLLFDEMQAQNILGKGSHLEGEGLVFVLDCFYVFQIVWNCHPQKPTYNMKANLRNH